MRKERPTKNLSVIARAVNALNCGLHYISPKQSTEVSYEANGSNGITASCSVAGDCFVTPMLRKVVPRNDGYLIRLVFVSYFLFQISHLASAQSPYTGGSGDGHAMGELVLRNVGMNELGNSDGYLIYPSQAKAGEAIYITSPAAGELQLIDITGRIIYTHTMEQPVQQLPVVVTQAGLCIGIIRTQTGTFTQKIIMVE